MKRPLFVILTGVVFGETITILSARAGMMILALSVPVAVILFLVSQNGQSPFHQLSIVLLLLITAGFFGGLCYCAETDISFAGSASGGTWKQSAGFDEQISLHGRILSVRYIKDNRHQKDKYKNNQDEASQSEVAATTIKLVVEKKQDHFFPYPHSDSEGKGRSDTGYIAVTLELKDYGEKSYPCFYPDDTAEIKGSLRLLPDPTNPGEFDLSTWYLSQGIKCILKADSCHLLKRPRFSFRRTAWKVKERISRVYQSVLAEDQAALLNAMVLGEKSDLSDEQKRQYSENGAAHLLAVSGLHISILGGSLYSLLRKRGFGYGISCLSGGSLLVFYGCMTGFGSSAARAVIMYLVFLAAGFIGADYDIISAMSLSGIMLLIEHPVRLKEGGFQISYISILAIGLVLPWAKEQIGKKDKQADRERLIKDRLKESLFTGGVISAVTGPVLIRLFYEWAPVGILLNLILLPCMAPIMVSAIAGGLTGIIYPGAGKLFLWPAACLLTLFEKIFTISGLLHIRPLITGCPAIWQIVLIYLLEAVIFLMCMKPGIIRILVLLVTILIYLADEYSGSISLLSTVKELKGLGFKDYMAVDMLDVGQGECILIRTADRKTVLIDGGSSSRSSIGKYVIIPALKYYGVKSLDYVVATHMDKDHISGLMELFQSSYPINHVLVPNAGTDDPAWRSFTGLARDAGAKVIPVNLGDKLQEKNFRMYCLHPLKGARPEDRNDSSVVFALSFKEFDMLFTGDLGEEGEKILEESTIKQSWDVLKVAHHGSKYSTQESFLTAFPGFKAALISAGRQNRYGHPHTELMERLRKRNIRIYDTPHQGAIQIKTDGFSYRISGFL